MINKIKKFAGEFKEAVISSGVTVKQLALGKAHMQDYMCIGAFFFAGVLLGSCL
tara:strand:- start:1194 stop:1355 length:162 start_codon:yes stop_codon:yes gene_type:complete